MAVDVVQFPSGDWARGVNRKLYGVAVVPHIFMENLMIKTVEELLKVDKNKRVVADTGWYLALGIEETDLVTAQYSEVVST
jgi:hypothetical protein